MTSTNKSEKPEMLDFEDFKEQYQKVPVEEYPNNVVEAVPEPMVSVHVSTYQHADFIRDCLDGVLMQETDFPMEIIIGEDESDDGTREICKEYADQHPDKIRLFLHRRENNISIHGEPTGRFQNVYSKFKCRGRYVAVCEGDDYWRDEKKIKKQVNFLESNGEYILSHHDAIVVDESGNKINDSHIPNKNKKNFKESGLVIGPWLIYPSLCWKNVIKEYPKEFFHSPFGDRFVVSILGTCGKAKYQKKIRKSGRRIHEGGAWSSKTRMEQIKGKIEGYKNIYKYQQRSKDVSTSIKKRIKKLKKDMYIIKRRKIGKNLVGLFTLSVNIINEEGVLFLLELVICIVKTRMKK